MKQIVKDTVGAYSFMGLMAGEGQIPGRSSSPLDEVFLSDRVDALWNFVSGTADAMTEDTTFFDLMVDAGQMEAREQSPKEEWVWPV